MSDNGSVVNQVLREFGRRIERARIHADFTQADLAERAGVSLSTVRRLEDGAGSQLSAALTVLRALGLLDLLFDSLPLATPGPSDLLENRGRPRQRASGKRKSSKSNDPSEAFQWGDEKPGGERESR